MTENSNALRQAEQRAENAERRAEQLEQRIEALENSSHPADPASNPGLQPHAVESPNDDEAVSSLRNEPMMDHLLNALDAGEDIGHYGRLVFAMVAHHFLSEESMFEWLTKDPGINQEEAAALLRHG